MLRKLQIAFQNECLLNSTRILVVGVSGGPDSLCLLDALHRSGYRVVAAHLDHQLRAESSQDAQFVEQISRQMDVPFVMETADVRSYADLNSLSIEEAARLLRYRFLFSEAVRLQAQAVAVGHTADDQIETVLMHWLRGAGLDGLKGMLYRQLPNAWSDAIPLVRPLLGIFRDEIWDYCQTYGLEPVIDRSNLDQTYYRNRLRHDLIPYLKTYNPAICENLLRMVQILQQEEILLEKLTEEAWIACVRHQEAGCIAFHRESLLNQPLALQRRLLRKAIAQQRPGLRDISFQVIERATQFLKNPPATRQSDLVAGIRLFNEADLTWLASWEASLPAGDWPQVATDSIVVAQEDMICPLAPGWRLFQRFLQDFREAFEEFQRNPDPYQAWLDADCLKWPLLIRPRRSGDRFQPLGMTHGSVKISDYMINVKLPRRARAGWPLVCSQDQVIWLPGFSIHHAVRITSQTRRVVHLRLGRVSEEE